MSDISLKDFAKVVGISTERLMSQLNDAGIEANSENDVLSDQNKSQLLEHLRKHHGENDSNQNVIQLVTKNIEHINMIPDSIRNAKSLRELNDLLTKLMAKQQIQVLIKDENLDVVVDTILRLAGEAEQELLAAAMLGRLAAVARSRESKIFDRVDELFTKEPPSIETLDDGDAKAYAAMILGQVDEEWLARYSLCESMLIDTADNARRELLSASLKRESTIADWLRVITKQAGQLKTIEDPEKRLKRTRRIFGVMSDLLARWQGDVGSDVGLVLAECLHSFFKGKLIELDQQVLFEALDNVLSILSRVIELRFSTALYAETYSVLVQGKKTLGPGAWGRFISQSEVMPVLRVMLMESALVLARQNRTDKQIMKILVACYTSRPQVAAAIKRHFSMASDLDPDVANWWCSVGDVSENQRKVEHKVGNSEDAQIGALLIEVESNSEAMDKVGRAVVPLLEISDAVLASTVRKAVNGYQDIAQTARRLARMRKLTKTDLKGERMEYNPLEHEMLGGHKTGIRRIKVVRDGIKKEFSGKTKTLVKPWVEPEEE